LSSLAVIEAESSSPRDLLLSSLDEAVGAANSLAVGAERVGESFRGFDVKTANEDLTQLAQGLGTLVAIVQALSQAVGVDLANVSCAKGTGAQMIDELIAHADSLIASQSTGDWITVADVIEYDIAPALRAWPDLLDALRGAVPDVPRSVS
ncbi:MAG TPA: hypothetical protein VGK32_05800, partial [Vicinamibacterales bacterium]